MACAARILENNVMAIVAAQILAVLKEYSEGVTIRSSENSSPAHSNIALICRSNTVIRNKFLSSYTQ